MGDDVFSTIKPIKNSNGKAPSPSKPGFISPVAEYCSIIDFKHAFCRSTPAGRLAGENNDTPEPIKNTSLFARTINCNADLWSRRTGERLLTIIVFDGDALPVDPGIQSLRGEGVHDALGEVNVFAGVGDEDVGHVRNILFLLYQRVHKRAAKVSLQSMINPIRTCFN